MKSSFLTLAALASMTFLSSAATVNWSAGVDHGFSLANGTNLPTGSVVKLGHFRNPSTGVQLSDSEIAAADLATLQAAFIEAGSSTIGSGFTPGIAGHFSVASTINTGSAGLNIAGKQMFVWVLNGASVAASTQHAILYWAVSDTTANPDGSPQVPGVRWVFPPEEPIPGSTTIDATDLTTGTGSLAAGARLVVGTYPTGTSAETSASNFGLAPIDAPLAIPTAPALAGGLVGVAYSQTVVAQGGRSPYGFSVTSGTLPAGLNLGATTGVISGNPTAAVSSTFEITVEDDLDATLSKTFTLVVAGSPLAITTAPALGNISQGLTYSQALAASGGTAPLAWSLSSGSLPAGLTLAADGTLSGIPTGSGSSSFTVEVTDAGSLVDSETFTINVLVPPAISTPSTLPSAIVGTAYTQTFLVPGAGPLAWSVTVGAPPAGLALSAAGILSGTPTAAGTSSFTVQVVGPGGTSKKVFTLTVLADAVAPEVIPPVFPPASVSDGTFSYTLQASPRPDSFIVLGLPPGLKADPKTGIITGRPATAGMYVVRVKAKNARGTSDEVSGVLIVQALPTGSIGTFIGHVERDTAVNGKLGGRIDLSTTAAGAYTLKLTQGLVTTSMKGFVKVVPGEDPTISDTSTTGIVVNLAFDSAANSVAGTIGVGAATADAYAWRSTWNKLTAPASYHAGYYTMGISHATRPTSSAVPLGHGYASFTVGLDGKLIVKGKTADGNAITCAGFMGSDGQILVFQQLYKKLGTLIGQVDIALDPNKTFQNRVSGTVSWSSPSPPFGIEPIDQDCDGDSIANGPKGGVVLGLPASSSPVALLFDEDGLALNSALDPDVPAFTFNSLLKPVMPALGVANPGGVKLTINVADGSFKGTFVLEDIVSGKTVKRTVPYEGLIVRSSSGTVKGKGYFLAPQNGSTQKLSGTVTIEQ